MDFTYYPIEDSSFFKNKKLSIVKEEGNNCLNTPEIIESKNINVSYGYHKPLNEICKPVDTNHFNTGPDESNTGSIWNNMTRRKSVMF